MPLGVLELQRANGHIICDHSKNCVPCHMSNLDLTIITSTWIPPYEYPCQVCQRTNDADQMLLCDNCNGGYHLFCSSRSSLKFLPIIGIVHHVFLHHLDFYSNHATFFPTHVLGGDTWKFHFNLLLCIIYMCVCVHLFLVD